ncbi:MAG: hypothetical protein JWP36_228 [Paucimonas sp.]|nr:hypothetical protein [Paucimonas sp.]
MQELKVVLRRQLKALRGSPPATVAVANNTPVLRPGRRDSEMLAEIYANLLMRPTLSISATARLKQYAAFKGFEKRDWYPACRSMLLALQGARLYCGDATRIEGFRRYACNIDARTAGHLTRALHRMTGDDFGPIMKYALELVLAAWDFGAEAVGDDEVLGMLDSLAPVSLVEQVQSSVASEYKVRRREIQD